MGCRGEAEGLRNVRECEASKPVTWKLLCPEGFGPCVTLRASVFLAPTRTDNTWWVPLSNQRVDTHRPAPSCLLLEELESRTPPLLHHTHCKGKQGGACEVCNANKSWSHGREWDPEKMMCRGNGRGTLSECRDTPGPATHSPQPRAQPRALSSPAPSRDLPVSCAACPLPRVNALAYL